MLTKVRKPPPPRTRNRPLNAKAARPLAPSRGRGPDPDHRRRKPAAGVPDRLDPAPAQGPGRVQGLAVLGVRRAAQDPGPDPGPTVLGTGEAAAAIGPLTTKEQTRDSGSTSRIWTQTPANVIWRRSWASTVRSGRSGWPDPCLVLLSSSTVTVRMPRRPSGRWMVPRLPDAGFASRLPVPELVDAVVVVAAVETAADAATAAEAAMVDVVDSIQE